MKEKGYEHHRGNYARHIIRRVLASKDKTTSNATNATKTRQSRRAKSPLPLSTNIIRLIRHCSRDIRVRARGGEEHAKVAHAGVGVEAHDGQADDGDEGVDDDDGAAHAVPVANPGHAEHEDCGEDVGGCDEALGGGHAEAHVVAEDDGEEDYTYVSVEAEGSG